MSSQRQRRQRRADHVGVEVALAAEALVGVELGDRDVLVGQPVGVQRARHVALQDARPHAVEPGQRRLEQRRLPRPRRAHQVQDRDALAVEVGAVGRRDRVVGVEGVLDDPHLDAMHSLVLLDLDRIDLQLVAGQHLARAAALRAAEHQLRLQLVRARLAAHARRHHLLLQPRALGGRLARHDVPVERERVRDHLPQAARPAGDHQHPAALCVAQGRVHHRARDRQLVHQGP